MAAGVDSAGGLRHPAQLRLAISHTVDDSPDFELQLPWVARLMDVRLQIAARLGLSHDDASQLEITCPSRDYIKKGWPRWAGHLQDMIGGKYSLMKHARRTGWRLEVEGGYDNTVADEAGFLEAKTFSAMRHSDVMSLHVELVLSDEEHEDDSRPSKHGTTTGAQAEADARANSAIHPGDAAVEQRSRQRGDGDEGGTEGGEEELQGVPPQQQQRSERTRTGVRGTRPLASRLDAAPETQEEGGFQRKSRWGGVNSHLEGLHLQAYAGATAGERATAYKELTEMREKAAELAKARQANTLTLAQQAVAREAIRIREQVAREREEERQAKEREAAEAQRKADEEAARVAAEKAAAAQAKRAAKKEARRLRKEQAAAEATAKAAALELQKQTEKEEKEAEAKRIQDASRAAKKKLREEEKDEEVYYWSQARDRSSAVACLRILIFLVVLGVVAACIAVLHTLLYSCANPVNGSTFTEEFSPLNLQLLSVQKNVGSVSIRAAECNTDAINSTACIREAAVSGCDSTRCCCIRVRVDHRGASINAAKLVRTKMKMQDRVLSIVSGWDVETTSVFDCPQSDITVWLPRDVAVGVLNLKQIVDPNELLGDGYFDPTPVTRVNLAELHVAINATSARSWMVPVARDLHVSMDLDVPFAGASLYSNAGDLHLHNFNGADIKMRADGGSITATNVHCTSLDVEARAAHAFTSPDWQRRIFGVVPPIPLLFMWPALHRYVGNVELINITEQGRTGTQDAMATLSAGYVWMASQPTWKAQAYREYQDTRATNVLSGPSAWNGRFLEPQMWLSFDLGQIYTIAGLRFTAFEASGPVHKGELFIRSDLADSWSSLKPFIGLQTLSPQIIDGFEGTGRFVRLEITTTHNALVDTGVAGAAGMGATLFSPQRKTINAWQEMKYWITTTMTVPIGLFVTPQFDSVEGRYTASQIDQHICSLNLLLVNVHDTAPHSLLTMQATIALNGLPDANNGLHVANSRPDPDLADFSISGVL
eukprot:COSAG01_NODE_5766_length_4045_cov_1048.388650_1_plen_998_part_10